MKKKIIAFTFLIFTFNAKSNEYLKYHSYVILAQNSIIDNQLDTALLKYKIAFKLVEKGFPKDFLNAASLCYELDSLNLMKKYISSAINNGGYYRFIYKRFKKKIHEKDFWRNISLRFDEINKEKNNNINFIKVKSVFDIDQKLRRGIFKKNLRKIENTDSIVKCEMNNFFLNDSYPGFISIGTFKGLDMMSIMLMHIGFENAFEIIERAVIKGEITPFQAYYIYERQIGDPRSKLSSDNKISGILKLILNEYNIKYDLSNHPQYKFNRTIWF